MKTKQLRILFVDDDEIEYLKLTKAIGNADTKHLVYDVANGEEALDYLNNTGSLPDIILLDLNMPKLGGIDFLRALKDNVKLCHIPTIILTTSVHRQDLKECYKLGIAGYVLKPLSFADYSAKIVAICSYWSMNELIDSVERNSIY